MHACAWSWALAAAYAAASAWAAAADAARLRIPNAACALMAAAALAQGALAAAGAPVLAWLGPLGERAAWAAGVLALGAGAELACRRARGGRRAVGMGDIKLASAEALWLGPGVLAALALASASALLVEWGLRRRRSFPFGPHIAGASVACLVMEAAARGALT